MSLLDEVKSAATTTGAKCSICQWLATADDADEWREVFAAGLDVAQHSAVRKVLQKHGHDFSIHQVTNHRREHAWKSRVQA